MKKKTSSHWKNLEMSTKGAHSKFLPLLFEMPQGGIMSGSVKKKLRSSFFGNMIIKSEELNYHISRDFYAPFAAA